MKGFMSEAFTLQFGLLQGIKKLIYQTGNSSS